MSNFNVGDTVVVTARIDNCGCEGLLKVLAITHDGLLKLFLMKIQGMATLTTYRFLMIGFVVSKTT